MKTYDTKKIQKLATQILIHKRLYYSGKPEITDQAYDALEDELRSLAPEHPLLNLVGTMPDGPASIKVEHSVPMLSLAKTYDREDIISWMGQNDIVGTYKIDGNSVSLIYRQGTLVQGKTRGNGRIGENVTEKILWVKDCVAKLGTNLDYEIRGELVCSLPSFVKLSDTMSARGLEKPTNPRNIVAGILGRKTNLDLANYFSFYAFDVLDENGQCPFATEIAKYLWLEEHGFTLPPYSIINQQKSLQDYLVLAKDFLDNGDVGIDGVVFAYNDVSLHRELGSTSHHPRFKLSFKWAGETAVAEIKAITWATSRFGVVTPVAVIEPVSLSGAKITNITLHNASHVVDHNLKVGDRIEIIRSGEVIPKFLRVVDSKTGDYLLPSACVSCGSKLILDEVRLICKNADNCPAQRLGGLLNWIRAAEIEDLSEKRLTAMLESGMVDDIADLYKLSKDDLVTLPLTKEKMATKLLKNIRNSKNIPLTNFLVGLGIPGIGRNNCELLLKEFPTLEDIRGINSSHKEKIVNIQGFAEKSAEQIIAGLDHRSKLIEQLIGVGVTPAKYESAESSGLIFSGMSFVITGTLSKPRNQIQKAIKTKGGNVGGAVTSNTNVLITNDPESNSSKAKKARELGIDIWTEEDLDNRMNV